MKTLNSKTVLMPVFTIALICTSVACSQNDKIKQAHRDQAKSIFVVPSEIKWFDTEFPGQKMAILAGDPKKSGGLFTVRIKDSAGFKIPTHWHPNDEHVTVLSGTLYFGLGDKFDRTKAKAYPAGSYFMIPGKTYMYGWAEEDFIVQVHGVAPFEVHLLGEDHKSGWIPDQE